MSVGGLEFVDQIWWYASRAAGILAWVLLSLVVITGMALPGGRRVLPAGWLLDLHRFLSTLSFVFLTAHVVLLVPDNFVHFGVRELLIPMASSWEPEAVAWGVVALWLGISVEVSSLVRSRIPGRLWRAIHYLSFVTWGLATVHLFRAGTDVGHPVFRVVQAVAISAVALGLTLRVRRARRRSGSGGVGPLTVQEPVDVDEVDSGERRELATGRR